MTKYKKDKDSGGYYSAWFFDLTGGKTEYVVTIATVIGKSRMKGKHTAGCWPKSVDDELRTQSHSQKYLNPLKKSESEKYFFGKVFDV